MRANLERRPTSRRKDLALRRGRTLLPQSACGYKQGSRHAMVADLERGSNVASQILHCAAAWLCWRTMLAATNRSDPPMYFEPK